MTRHVFPFLVILLAITAQSALAQAVTVKPGSGGGKNKGTNSPEVKRLDAKLEEVRDSFLRETTNLIFSYEKLGQLEQAKMLLESLQKLDPKNEPIRVKLGELNAKIIENNEFEVNLDTEKGWQQIGSVTKDRPLRIRVQGETRLMLQLSTGPEGVPTANPLDDLVPGVPLGAVMGVVAPAGFGGPGATGGADKPPRPFNVGTNFDKPSDRDGVLYLKINAPEGTKCTGRLTARVSGPNRIGAP